RLDESDLVLFTDDIHAEFDAFVADEDGGAGDQLAHLVLALSAEGAVEGALGVAASGFRHQPISLIGRVRIETIARHPGSALCMIRAGRLRKRKFPKSHSTTTAAPRSRVAEGRAAIGRIILCTVGPTW